MSVSRLTSDTAIPGATAFFLCALLGTSPVAASGASPGGNVEEDSERDPRLKPLRDAIEMAFKTCDAGSLDTAFSREVKTYLSSRALGVRPGYYGVDQVRMILRRSFKGRATVRFGLNGHDGPASSGGSRFLIARWLFRDDGGPKVEARLSFTLAREDATWRIREIRELR